MARSKRKTPVFGNCCGSDTAARRKANKARRRLTRTAMAVMGAEDFDAVDLPVVGEGAKDNPWSWPQDGRNYRGHWLTGDNAKDYKLLAK